FVLRPHLSALFPYTTLFRSMSTDDRAPVAAGVAARSFRFRRKESIFVDTSGWFTGLPVSSRRFTLRCRRSCWRFLGFADLSSGAVSLVSVVVFPCCWNQHY